MFNVFKIPPNKGKNQLLYVVGIIDASGSMEDCWPWVVSFWNKSIPKDHCITITFDKLPHLANDNKLTDDILAHGGGSTKIPEAFQFFETQIEKIPKDATINVVFVSDGDDDNMKTVEERCGAMLKGAKDRRVNFICLGIQSGFPTFLAMKLRQIYHTGDKNIPAVFLIEFPSEKAFFNKFETMNQYFSNTGTYDITPKVRLYPWGEEVDEVYENSWVLSKEPCVIINDEKLAVDENGLGIEEIVDLFRGWVQQLQLISLTDVEKSKDFSKMCLEEMSIHIEKFKAKTGLDLKAADQDIACGTFSQRVMKNLVKNMGIRVLWYLNEVEALSKGINPQALNEFDAAKRIGIGTITGKYHQKALALKGITVQNFKEMCEEFKVILGNTKLNPDIESMQEKSVMTLQNQKEAFLDKDFVKGLDMCNSQYDLVASFPVVGYAIKIKRYDGSMMNPWLIEMRFIAKTHKAIDMTSLVQNKMRIDLKVGDKQEEINAVLPLFDKGDEDMANLINSRLYRLLLTFNMVLNVDTYYDEAYLALLANACVFMFNSEESQWRAQILNQIFETMQITFMKNEEYLQYYKLFASEKFERVYAKSHDLSKPFLTLFMLCYEKKLSTKEIEARFDSLIIELFHRFFESSQLNYAKFLNFKLDFKAIEEEILKKFPEYLSISDMKHDFKNRVKETATKCVDSSEMTFSQLYSDKNKFKLYTFESFQSLFLNKKYQAPEYSRFACHAHKNMGGLSRFEPIPNEIDIKAYNSSFLNPKTIGKLSNYTQSMTKMTNEYQKFFAEIHWNIRPFTHKELMELCAQKGLKIEEFKFRPTSYLFRNACMAEKCHHFLKVMTDKQMDRHLDSWCGTLPMGFHKFVLKNLEKDQNWVLENFLFKVHKFENLKVTKEFALGYIEKIRGFYLEIPEEERKKYQESAQNEQKMEVEARGRGRERGHGRGGKRGGRGKGARGRGRGRGGYDGARGGRGRGGYEGERGGRGRGGYEGARGGHQIDFE